MVVELFIAVLLSTVLGNVVGTKIEKSFSYRECHETYEDLKHAYNGSFKEFKAKLCKIPN